jgi:hypothetical protein
MQKDTALNNGRLANYVYALLPALALTEGEKEIRE